LAVDFFHTPEALRQPATIDTLEKKLSDAIVNMMISCEQEKKMVDSGRGDAGYGP